MPTALGAHEDGGRCCADAVDRRKGVCSYMYGLGRENVQRTTRMVDEVKRLADSDRAGRIKCYDVTAEDDWAEVSVKGTNFVQDSVVIQA